MTGYYARMEALKIALELIPENSKIAMGGCMSAHEISFDLLRQAEEQHHYMDKSRWNLNAGGL